MRNMQLKAVAKDVQKTDTCAKELQVTGTALMRYRGAMAGIVRSMGVNGPAVEDVVHDAFEMACRKAEGERPDPQDEARFLSWLCTLAKYAALTARNDNARCREVSSPSEELEDVADTRRAYLGHYDDKVAASVVMSHLSADDRELIQQHFFEDKTVKELAEEHRVPWTTMRSRIDGVIHRARSLMDDKSGRRRGVGAIFFGLLGLRFTDLRQRLQETWGRSRSAFAAGVVGVLAGGTIFVAVDAHVDQTRLTSLATSAGAIAKLRSEAPELPVTYAAGTHIPAGLGGLAVSPLTAAVHRDKPKSVANAQPVQVVKEPFRERAIVPWSVSAAIRDHAHEQQNGR